MGIITLIIAAFIVYMIVGLKPTGENEATPGKTFVKFLYLMGMLFISGFVFVIFIDENGFIAIVGPILILGVSLWGASKW